jgi:hypothetical protein
VKTLDRQVVTRSEEVRREEDRAVESACHCAYAVPSQKICSARGGTLQMLRTSRSCLVTNGCRMCDMAAFAPFGTGIEWALIKAFEHVFDATVVMPSFNGRTSVWSAQTIQVPCFVGLQIRKREKDSSAR